MHIDSTTHSALQGINSAQAKASTAAQAIAKLPLQSNEVGSTNYKSTDLIKPIISLTEAELQNSASVKVLQASNQALGSFFNDHA